MMPDTLLHSLPQDLLPLAEGFSLALTFPVQWGEMDAYRHVNNVVYFRYFENARAAYFQAIGWPEIESRTGIGPILASAECRFRRAITYPDLVTVAIRVTPPLQQDRFLMECRILSHKLAALAAEAKGVIVAYNYAQQCKATFPDDLRQRISQREGWSTPPTPP
ncbi:MAG: acyl-CoA thioesterase [Gemmatales bacterium]|nr:acyl-CoA thioesterase [Gemmatales bacterium]MCS7161253.1 acyl-CoA thioesterase [Gemmatales bacterium]MDW8176456.1 acyl-CoA thioesterase [Gemmatales bacterium]MDW8223417.1 acyl-CoA thioesterase [Gemmatales bacterium]